MTEMHINTRGCTEPLSDETVAALAKVMEAAHARANLAIALNAVDQLNSWVRSPSFRSQDCYGLKRHIYRLKRYALQRAAVLLDLNAAPTTVEVRCYMCDGSGRFCDWQQHQVCGKPQWVWVDLAACRRCAGTGKTSLDFIVSAFTPGPGEKAICWHTPRQEWPLSSLLLGDPVSPGTWTTNKPGNDLTVDEAATLLVQADAVLLPFGLPCYCESYREYERHYGLHIGRVTDVCQRCGCQQDLQNLGCRIGRVHYTLAFCKACYALRGIALFKWPPVPPLLTPAVSTWIKSTDACSERAR